MATDYQVYVLQNKLGRFYIGLSEDPERRLDQHNAGVSKWTRTYRPWTLVWRSDRMSLGDARRFESLLKRQKGGAGFFRMTRMDPPASS